MSSNRSGSRRASMALGTVVTLATALTVGAASPRFFPDDPIQADNDRAIDASGIQATDSSNYYDFAQHTFFGRGERVDLPASNVNTLGEVPDSTWFNNRMGRVAMSTDEIVRGPDRYPTLNIDGWPIVRDKGTGLQAGFRMTDPDGHLYQVEFDPVTNPEMATGAEMIGTAFYHAFGYNVVDVYLVEFDPEQMVVAPNATMMDITGRRREMTRYDVDQVLIRAARQPDGKYRALASRFADGAPLGHFQYFSTRPDDPNDVFPHEHRRELRGNRVFAAWLNHDDSRGINSLDMLEGPEGQKYVKHYMFDFGSILGSGTAFAQVPRGGNEYIVARGEAIKTLASLGLYVRPWMLVDYPDVPDSVGRFEGDFFQPDKWKPEYPNPAFDNMQPADAFWAAKIISTFTDDIIRAVVQKARYSEPEAATYITDTLIKRRQKVLTTWLNGVNPLDNFALDASGRLTFENAAVRAGVAQPATSYRAAWSRFDNQAQQHEQVGDEITTTDAAIQAPAGLLDGSEYIAVLLRTVNPNYAAWQRPLRVYFRKSAGGWQNVGIERDEGLAVRNVEVTK